MSIYRAPDPPMGPDRPSDAYPPGPDHADWRGIREWEYVGPSQMWSWQDPELWQRSAFSAMAHLGPEQFATHEDYQAARELDEWGCNPFEEE